MIWYIVHTVFTLLWDRVRLSRLSADDKTIEVLVLRHQLRARTTSTSVALRLFFVALAFLLLNLWNLVKASTDALPPFAA